MSNKTILQSYNTRIQELIDVVNSLSRNEKEMSFPNGKKWIQSNIADEDFYCIYNANDIWVAGGNEGLYYSTDGQTWTQSNITSGNFKCVYNANGVWVASGVTGANNGLYYSITWEENTPTEDPLEEEIPIE